MSRPRGLFVTAALSAIGAVVVLGAGEASPLVWFVAVVGASVALFGGAAGQPALVFAGAAALMAAYGFTLAGDASDAVDTLAFTLLLWLSVELMMRSMELRRSTVPTRGSTLGWLAGVGLVAGGTALLWLVVSAVESAAPSGGILFRVLAVVAVVAVAIIVSGVPRSRRNEPGLPG